MYEKERELAIAVVAEASGLGRAVQDQIAAAAEAVTKGDRSPVTVADLAIQAVVSTRLAAACPGDPLLAEEDSAALVAADGAPLAARVLALVRRALPDADLASVNRALDRGAHAGGGSGRFWVLDPVDGTKGFLRGEHYAVALALVENGQVVVGALGCPNLALDGRRELDRDGTLLVAVAGGGSFARACTGGRERRVTVDAIDDPAQAVMCESVEAAHADHAVHAAITGSLGITAAPYRIDSQCKYGIVARGDASVYLRLPSQKGYREKVWDHAAGALVISEAGGRVSDLDGRPLDFSGGRLLATARGIVATNGRLHDRVLAAARAATGE